MVVLALTAYAQNMYFFIAPAAIAACGAITAVSGQKKRHAAMAAALGLLLCVPAVLTGFTSI